MTSHKERDALIESALTAEGYEYLGAWRERDSLCVFIDHAEGVSVNDCQKASQLLSPLLLAEGVLNERMGLDVSSPGLNRPLFKPCHYQKQIGQEVQIKLLTSLGGRKRFKGNLDHADEQSISVSVDQESFKIDYAIIDRANVCYRGTFNQ